MYGKPSGAWNCIGDVSVGLKDLIYVDGLVSGHTLSTIIKLHL